MASKLNYLKKANDLGYASERELYEVEYVKKNKSTREIAVMLGISQNNARLRIKRSGIVLNHRGGINHAKRTTKPAKMCKCGIRPVAHGNHWLCDYCYKVKTFEYERSWQGL